MPFFQYVFGEFRDFFSLGPAIDLFKHGNYRILLTKDGFFSVVGPIMPLLLLVEIVRAFVYRKFKIEEYRIPFLIFVFNRFVSRFISIAMVSLCIGWFNGRGIFKSSFTWYWIIYGYIAWELSHFVYHFLAHKVRILWCLHSTHHVPQSMNLTVSYAHFFLEAPYADLVRTSICLLLGVTPPVLFFVMFCDGIWGVFIHVGENVMKDARLGFLGRLVLTPSFHRVHHARNPLYMDTNFCNLLNIWDHAFGTYQKEDRSIPVEYGITRPVNHRNFLDVYFGEIYWLVRDVRRAPGLRNKFLYIIMPPGWSHDGNHHTAKVARKEYLDSLQKTEHPSKQP